MALSYDLIFHEISKMRRKRQESREVATPFRQIVKYVMSQAQSLQETVAIAQYYKSGMRGLYHGHPVCVITIPSAAGPGK